MPVREGPPRRGRRGLKRDLRRLLAACLRFLPYRAPVIGRDAQENRTTMTANRSFRLILAGGLVALVAACGGAGSAPSQESGDGSETGTTPTDATPRPTDVPFAEADATPGTALSACEILTADDIAAATGAESVADGDLKDAATVLDEARTECTYEGDFGRIIVDLTPTDGANLYDAAIGAYDGAVLYDGIGDGAFWSEKNNRAFFWKGSVNVMLTIFLNDADPAATAEELGSVAIGKV